MRGIASPSSRRIRTYFDVAMYAVERGHHVLITKPAVKLLRHHVELLQMSRNHSVFVDVEHHKRFDPAHADARHRAKTSLGDLNYFYNYMSQPKSQLETFKAWAGRESDISHYLNSHHVDVCVSMVDGWVPRVVRASASEGIAEGLGCMKGTEDTITLMVEWQREGKRATGIYTASWTAPRFAGVHSNQSFHWQTWHPDAKSASIKPSEATTSQPTIRVSSSGTTCST
ncbi:hypothetical protein GJ744_011652 [Endocarpon pusillum]|uniref:Ig-like domain-containing protein n=1 Tax=Endocarpon pusillum TaxID=364733 RepID=A0A8H7AG56_9EURO|nr:hypothetical protein GJ744_011652 [Endocarpon pusillum]